MHIRKATVVVNGLCLLALVLFEIWYLSFGSPANYSYWALRTQGSRRSTFLPNTAIASSETLVPSISYAS